MQGFSEDQDRALKAKLREAHVRQRHEDGVSLSYVEGWHVVSEANRIFGFDGWDRETVESTCIWQGSRSGRPACSYVARVRITVRAGDHTVTREGSGSGHGDAFTLGEAHENALKEAETDATKRALSTFGNPFGLALYDRDRRGVTKTRNAVTKKSDTQTAIRWPLKDAGGNIVAEFLEPVEFCRLLKIQVNTSSEAQGLKRLHQANQPALRQLRRDLPALRNERGFHYVDLVEGLFAKRTDDLKTADAGNSLLSSHNIASRVVASKGNPADAVNGSAPINEPDPAGQERADTAPRNGGGNTPGDGQSRQDKGTVTDLGTRAIDKSTLLHSGPKRIRDPEHRRQVARQPCLICGRQPSQAHHLRFVQPRAMGRKVSDAWTVPLCVTHHRQLHEAGDEEKWWAGHPVNPKQTAEGLWRERHQPQLKDESIS